MGRLLALPLVAAAGCQHVPHRVEVDYSEHLEPLVVEAFDALDRGLPDWADQGRVAALVEWDTEYAERVPFAWGAPASRVDLGLEAIEPALRATLEERIRSRPGWTLAPVEGDEPVDFGVVATLHAWVEPDPVRVAFEVLCSFDAGRLRSTEAEGLSGIVSFLPPYCLRCQYRMDPGGGGSVHAEAAVFLPVHSHSSPGYFKQ